jgi:hypothetical protein
MRSDRRALAGLFDALVFLAIASLVSVTMLSAMGGTSSANDRQSERVDAAHMALLRSTVPDDQGNQMTIEEIFMLRRTDRVNCEANITSILDLMLSGNGWRWSVETGSENWTFGTTILPPGPICCSVVRAPFNGSEVVFRLDCWAVQP